MKHIKIDKTVELPPTRGQAAPASSLAPAGEVFSTPDKNGGEHASLCFIGNATVILEWRGLRIMTDPNFLHAGDHVHLGPGVTSTRLKNPSTDLHDLPRVDLVLLSHYHEDHFDREVEDSLRRDLPIITTPHAYQHLSEAKGDGEAFTAVHPLDPFESLFVDDVANAHGSSIKVTAMPGKHFPPGPGNVFGAMNDALGMVPPTNGWMVELGNVNDGSFNCGYRIYISGDTLMVDELKEIPQRYKDQIIDLLLIHLGGTSIPSASAPLLMVTMDALQGLQLVQLINPNMTIPIHFDDYDVFKSPLDDFKQAMSKAGLQDNVVYLDHGDEYRFIVKSIV